ncbi:hypothetical protein C8R43DRAFT_5763 [Mycena crocata]|nr:hypothetical protein C8R43DRAFT_5763 [Mycena crocata]
MPLSLKAKLKTWASALKAYDGKDFERALELFSRIPKSSIILTNMGLIHAALGEHEAAVERFIEATVRDPYLAVAYFQCGVSNFLLARYDLAYRDFREAFRHLRGNQTINYEQIGLNFILFSAEVRFNQGLCRIRLEQVTEGLADLRAARQAKVTKDHNVIDVAIRDRGEGYTVFSIPVGICYRPSEKKLANAGNKDYMGEARLIAAIDLHDTATGFVGADRRGIHVETETIMQTSFAPSAIWEPSRSQLSRASSPSPANSEVNDRHRWGLARSKSTPKHDRSEMILSLGRSNTSPSKAKTLG